MKLDLALIHLIFSSNILFKKNLKNKNLNNLLDYLLTKNPNNFLELFSKKKNNTFFLIFDFKNVYQIYITLSHYGARLCCSTARTRETPHHTTSGIQVFKFPLIQDRPVIIYSQQRHPLQMGGVFCLRVSGVYRLSNSPHYLLYNLNFTLNKF